MLSLSLIHVGNYFKYLKDVDTYPNHTSDENILQTEQKYCMIAHRTLFLVPTDRLNRKLIGSTTTLFFLL